MNMAIHPGLRRRRWIGPHEAGVAVRQIHDKKVGLLLDTTDDHRGLAEIRLRISGRVRERHEHLASTALALPDIVFDDRVAAGETVLLAQPVIHALGGMALLGADLTIPVQPSVDDLGESVQLGALDRRRAAVTRRHRECHGLVDCVARDVEMTRRCALAHAVGAGQTNLPVKFHGIDLQALHAAA